MNLELAEITTAQVVTTLSTRPIGSRSQAAKTYLKRMFENFVDSSQEDLIKDAVIARDSRPDVVDFVVILLYMFSVAQNCFDHLILNVIVKYYL